MEQRKLWDAYVDEATDQAEGRRHQVRAGGQGSLLQGDAAGARQVRLEVRRADPAHPGYEVDVQVEKTGRRRAALFCHEKQLPPADAARCTSPASRSPGLALVAITLMIPSGVFMRYVMNDPLQWPEPASVIMMVFFSFVGGAAVYRANAQIAVEALMRAVAPPVQAAMQWGVHACMLLIAAFMLGYGVHLCRHHLGQHHRRVPVAVGRHRLHADPDRRPAHAAVHRREDLARRAAEGRLSCTATRPWTSSNGCSWSCSGRSRCCARSASRSPTRSASRR